MYKITVIETADELLRCVPRGDPATEDTLKFSGLAFLVFDNDFKDVFLQGDPAFDLDGKISVEDVIKALCKLAGIEVQIT